MAKTEGNTPVFGNRAPTYSSVNAYQKTEGSLCIAFCGQYGFNPYPWQEDILNDWLSFGDDGLWIHKNAGLMVPRQNGKTYLLDMREFYGAMVLGETVLHTAHERQTAEKAFKRMVELFGEYPGDSNALYPRLNAELRGYVRSAAQMIIHLKRGGCIEYRTRTKSGARGGTFDLVIVDEAQELDDLQWDAISSVNIAGAKCNPQTIFTGTPPTLGGRAEVFSRMHRTVHAEGEDADKWCWHEWGVNSVGDIRDKSRWYATNPSLNVGRIAEHSIEKDLVTMTPEGFAREHLGHWSDATKANPISDALWAARLVDSGPSEGRFAYGVKFSPDGNTVALAGAIKPPDGPIHVELIDLASTRRGMDKLVNWFMQRKGKAGRVAIDGITGAPTLEERLLNEGFPQKRLTRPSGRQAIEATLAFYEAVRSRGMTHGPGPALSASATGSIRRSKGKDGAWLFGSTPECDSTPIEACTFAYWAAKTMKGSPEIRQEIY